MNNRQLLEKFITENLDGAYRFAYSYTRNETSAEDVVSESVVKALKSVNSLKNQAYLKTWFYKIIINTALSHIKKESKLVYLNPESSPTIEPFAEDYSSLSFRELIDKLEPKYKSIIILRFFEDMTLEEIAMTLEENINTIKTRLYRGLKLLKIEMEEE